LASPEILKNLSIEKLQEVVNESGELLVNLQESNIIINDQNGEFAKDRALLGDADIYEITEKHSNEFKNL